MIVILVSATGFYWLEPGEICGVPKMGIFKQAPQCYQRVGCVPPSSVPRPSTPPQCAGASTTASPAASAFCVSNSALRVYVRVCVHIGVCVYECVCVCMSVCV